MRGLYYVVFRIFRFAIDKGVDRETPFFYTSLAVTLLVGFNIYTIYILLNYLNLIRDITEVLPNKFYILIPVFILWNFIYFGIAKPKRFLSYNFEKTKKGGFAVVGYIILTALTFVLVANLNRARLQQERLANPVKTEEVQEKKPSLESKIRKWFKG